MTIMNTTNDEGPSCRSEYAPQSRWFGPLGRPLAILVQDPRDPALAITLLGVKKTAVSAHRVPFR